MIFLTDDMVFPDVSLASKEGLLAIGGNLSLERLVSAYRRGIFPWFETNEPILWWSPDPRFVLLPEELYVSKSMRKLFRDKTFTVTYNKCFHEVILRCAKIKRTGQESSWITASMIEAYTRLFENGLARSVEVWQGKDLVGGLYGVDLNNGIFCGESMFSDVSNASKYGFITMVMESDYKIIDCQVHTEHLESLGARLIERDQFLNYLIC